MLLTNTLSRLSIYFADVDYIVSSSSFMVLVSIVGGLVLLFILVSIVTAICVCIVKRRKRNRQRASGMSTSLDRSDSPIGGPFWAGIKPISMQGHLSDHSVDGSSSPPSYDAAMSQGSD